MHKYVIDMTFAEVLEKSKELIESLKVQIEAMDQQVSEAYQQRVIAEEMWDQVWEKAEDKTEATKAYDAADDKYWELMNKQDDLYYKLDALERMVHRFKTINGIMDLVDLADHLAG